MQGVGLPKWFDPSFQKDQPSTTDQNEGKVIQVMQNISRKLVQKTYDEKG